MSLLCTCSSAQNIYSYLCLAGMAYMFGNILGGLILDWSDKYFFVSSTVIYLLYSASLILSDQVPTFAGQGVTSFIFGFAFGAYDVSYLSIVRKVTTYVTEGFGILRAFAGLSSLLGKQNTT